MRDTPCARVYCANPALAATPALGVPSGRRGREMGFVLEACKVLQACCDEANRNSILNTNVRRLLQASASTGPMHRSALQPAASRPNAKQQRGPGAGGCRSMAGSQSAPNLPAVDMGRTHPILTRAARVWVCAQAD